MTTHVYEFVDDDSARRFVECILAIKIIVRGTIVRGDVKNVVKVEYLSDPFGNKKKFLDAASLICGGFER